MIETDVLIIGTGPSGAAAASLLATYGVKPLVITKWNWTCRTPRAHITNQRAMEVFRDLGIEEEVNQKRTDQPYMGNNVFCTSLAGEELGRLLTWGTHPQRKADYTLASPTTICDVPQNLLEPILVGTAASRGATVMFNWEYQSLEQDADGVTVEVKDYVAQTTHKIRAKYVIGADGGRSKVAQDIGLPMEGKMGVAGSMNIVFEADLSKYVAHRPSVLYWVMQPGSDVGGIGMGLVRMVRPWHEWLIVWGYDINQPPPQVTDAMATEIAHNLIGDHTVPIKIKSTSVWTVNNMYALEHSRGRVFCVGDAVHRHPPSNGLGSNTSIQDSFNLAWKLAYVLKGQGGAVAARDLQPRARAHRQADRHPRQPVDRRVRPDLRGARAVVDQGSRADEGQHGQAARQQPRRRRAARSPAQGDRVQVLRVQLPRRRDEPALRLRRRRGRRLAGAGVEARQGALLSGLDPSRRASCRMSGCSTPTTARSRRSISAARGASRCLPASAARPGRRRRREIAAEFGLDIVAHVIGPGRDYQDYAGDWAATREIGEAGCILVRPDQFVAWRHASAADDAKAKLSDGAGQGAGPAARGAEHGFGRGKFAAGGLVRRRG